MDWFIDYQMKNRGADDIVGITVHASAIQFPLLDSYAINRKQKYFNKLHAASSSWITLRMEASALWYAASSLLLGRAWLLGWW